MQKVILKKLLNKVPKMNKRLCKIFIGLCLVGIVQEIRAQRPQSSPQVALSELGGDKKPAAEAETIKKKRKRVFLEGFGVYTLANGSSDSRIEGSSIADTVTYRSANPAGFGGGGVTGYRFTENFGVAGSFEYHKTPSRAWNASGISTATSTQNTFSYFFAGLGIRTFAALGPGEIYAGAGALFAIPQNDVTTVNSTTLATGASESMVKITSQYNKAFGAYGEIGYQIHFLSYLYVGVGARLGIVTVNNIGKTKVTEITNAAGTTTTTQTYRDGVSSVYDLPFTTKGLTDISVLISVGFHI